MIDRLAEKKSIWTTFYFSEKVLQDKVLYYRQVLKQKKRSRDIHKKGGTRSDFGVLT